MSTSSVSAKQIIRKWYVIDAKEKILGRLATDVAKILMGKNKIQYVPYLDQGDYVVVTNASKIKLTGKKVSQKKYASHSGYPGGYKEVPFKKAIREKPSKIIEHAVKGMLPKNKLGRQMIKKLKVFADMNHPYESKLKGEVK
ncbi:50S ribosomal protein L13 [Candidatus Daviesbacteria bacterium]|nr:50S ribosomal protein L13 [Candidatus Daviesbacteria bacterium]